MTTFNFNTLCAGRSLTTEESQALFTQVFEGKIDPALLAGILTALKIKGETPEEIEGAARAMVAAAAHFPRPRGVEVGEIFWLLQRDSRLPSTATAASLHLPGHQTSSRLLASTFV